MKNKKQVKMIILLMLISILVEVVISPLRAFDVRICSIVGFTAYFALVYYLSLKKGTILKPLSIFLAILSGCVLLQGIPRSFSFETSLISLPDAVMHVLGVLAGYAFYKASKRWRYVVAVVGLLLCVGIYSFHDLWLNKLNYGTFSGKVDIALAEQVQFLDPAGNVVRVADLKGTISILDFGIPAAGCVSGSFRKFRKHTKNLKKILK